MAPKKKGNKKAQDDWEAELGETIPPVDAQPEAPKEPSAPAQDGEDDFGGGLLASIQRRGKKSKKNKQPMNDFVEGEDPTADGAKGDVASDLDSKAPQEANLEEDDFYSAPAKKGKGQTTKQEMAVPMDDEPVDEEEAGGRIKTKKEKEKEKKEREKQRKKEQVCWLITHEWIPTSCTC